MEDIFRIKKIPYLGMIDGDIKPAHKIDNPSELAKQGRYFYSQGQWKLALSYFERIFVDFSTMGVKPGLFKSIAVCLINLKEYDKAIGYLKEGMRWFEDVKEYYVLYAEALRLQGYFSESKQLFEELKQKYPDDPEIQGKSHIASANYYIRKGDIAKATECYEQYKSLASESPSYHVADAEMQGWKLMYDVRSCIKDSWNFKMLERKLSDLLKNADNLDKKSTKVLGLLSRYRPLIESILDSLKGQTIDKSFCLNMAKQFKENHFFDEATFIEKIIPFNDFLHDLHEGRHATITYDIQKKALAILKTKTSNDLAEDTTLEAVEKGKKYYIWTRNGKETGTITTEDVNKYRQTRLLFVDGDKGLVYSKGKKLNKICGMHYVFLSALLTKSGRVLASHVHSLLYGDNEDRDDKHQRNSVASVKLKLKGILEIEDICTIKFQGRMGAHNHYYLAPKEDKQQKDFDWVFVKQVVIQ